MRAESSAFVLENPYLSLLNIFKGKKFLTVVLSDFQGLFQPKQFCGYVERMDVTPSKSSVEILFHIFLVFSGKIHVAYPC